LTKEKKCDIILVSEKGSVACRNELNSANDVATVGRVLRTITEFSLKCNDRGIQLSVE
jgi:hypothetical protein